MNESSARSEVARRKVVSLDHARFDRRQRRRASHALHWLLFDHERRVMGCQCGFRADVEDDEGDGDSVVSHLIGVGVQGP